MGAGSRSVGGGKGGTCANAGAGRAINKERELKSAARSFMPSGSARGVPKRAELIDRAIRSERFLVGDKNATRGVFAGWRSSSWRRERCRWPT